MIFKKAKGFKEDMKILETRITSLEKTLKQIQCDHKKCKYETYTVPYYKSYSESYAPYFQGYTLNYRKICEWCEKEFHLEKEQYLKETLEIKENCVKTIKKDLKEFHEAN